MSSTFACDAGMALSRLAKGADGARHPRLILATCVLASSLSFIDGSVLNVALPAIGRGFGASTAEVQWVINAYLLPLSALLLLGGAAGDQYGRRRLLLGGTALFLLASILCALAPSLALFLAGRALQGLGAAMLLPNSLAILSDTFSGEQRGKAVGIWAAAGAGAAAVAPLIGGWLVDGIGWPAIFLINVPIALGAILLGLLCVPESADRDRPPPDWPGAALATLALGALTWGLTLWSATRRASALSLASTAAGTILLLVFILVERRRRGDAMVPLALFRSLDFSGLNLLTFLLYGAFGGLMVVLPFTLIQAGNYSPMQAGAALLPLPILLALGSPLMGRLAARLGPRLPLTIGPLLVGAGFLLVLRIEGGGSYWAEILPAILLLSLGMAVAVAPLTTAVLASVDKRHTGTASGLNSAVARTGGLVATALLGGVLSQRGAALIASFHATAIACAAVAAAAGLTGFLMLSGKKKAGRKAA
jgi:EmrB/QacA subfamily drug resistance transporter